MSEANSGSVTPSQTSGKAIAIMVLGITSLVLFCAYGVGIIPAIVALAMARGTKREIAQSQGQIGGANLLSAGVVCSWVTVGLAIAALVIIGIILIVMAATGGFSN